MESRVRRPRAERRAEIAAAVLRLLGREGIAGVTTAGLAREVGLTSGAPFRHFDSLEAMLDAAVELAVARLAAGLPSDDDPPVARLRALARARVALLEEEPGIAWLLRAEQAVTHLSEASRQTLRNAILASRAFLLRALREGVARGDLRADVPVEILLAIFTATIHSLVGPRGAAHAVVKRPSPDELLLGLFRVFGAQAPEVSP